MTTTLKEACEKYLEHLKSIGKKPSTLGTAKRTLDLLIADMGEEKEVGKILSVHVDKFFKSEAATMQQGADGPKPRAQASVLQIRRIVRSALVYWHEQGLSKTIALPKDEKHFIEPKDKPAPSTGEEKPKADKPKRGRKAKKEETAPAEVEKEEPAAGSEESKAPADKKAWTGFDDGDDQPAEEGETVSALHFGKKEE